MAATYTLLSSQTVNTNTVNFTSISSSYTDLIVQAHCTISTTPSDIYLRFNSDATTNYQYIGASTQKPAGQIFEVVNSGGLRNRIDVVGEPNSQVITTNPNIFEIFIPEYSQSSYSKAGLVTASYITDISAPRNNTRILAWQWNPTTAISSINIIATTGNLVGTFNLFGILAA